MEADTSNTTDLGIAWSKQKIVKPSGIKLTIAGAILIITGLVVMVLGTIFLMYGIFFLDTGGGFLATFIGCAFLFNGTFSVVGGYFALKRTESKYVMYGAIANIFTFIVPGVIALILISLSADDCSDTED